VQTKLKCNEDLAFVIRMTRVEYVKALKSAHMECDLKSTSNKTIIRKKISLLMQYHDLEMIHGQ
jgi:hypothetical protein